MKQKLQFHIKLFDISEVSHNYLYIKYPYSFRYNLDGWNYFDISGCFFYSIAFILRLLSIWLVNENLYIAARIFFCIDLVIWYIRLLYITLLFKSLGPKIVMIQK